MFSSFALSLRNTWSFRFFGKSIRVILSGSRLVLIAITSMAGKHARNASQGYSLGFIRIVRPTAALTKCFEIVSSNLKNKPNS